MNEISRPILRAVYNDDSPPPRQPLLYVITEKREGAFRNFFRHLRRRSVRYCYNARVVGGCDL